MSNFVLISMKWKIIFMIQNPVESTSLFDTCQHTCEIKETHNKSIKWMYIPPPRPPPKTTAGTYIFFWKSPQGIPCCHNNTAYCPMSVRSHWLQGTCQQMTPDNLHQREMQHTVTCAIANCHYITTHTAARENACRCGEKRNKAHSLLRGNIKVTLINAPQPKTRTVNDNGTLL
jgi:hypothetical protein